MLNKVFFNEGEHFEATLFVGCRKYTSWEWVDFWWEHRSWIWLRWQCLYDKHVGIVRNIVKCCGGYSHSISYESRTVQLGDEQCLWQEE